jgi:predicted  nucleic acid-binding Zn-ribbon protein
MEGMRSTATVGWVNQTVLTLQQRCQSAKYKNVQYEKEIASLKQQLGSDAKASDLMRNLASVDEATSALLNRRDDTIADLRQQCLQYSQQLTFVPSIGG